MKQFLAGFATFILVKIIQHYKVLKRSNGVVIQYAGGAVQAPPTVVTVGGDAQPTVITYGNVAQPAAVTYGNQPQQVGVAPQAESGPIIVGPNTGGGKQMSATLAM